MTPPILAPYRAADGRDVVVTAGIAALDPSTLRPLYDDFETQAEWVLDRLDTVLSAAQATPLRVECFLAARLHFEAWNHHFNHHFNRHGARQPPARTTLICELPVPGLLIEVQAIAARTWSPSVPQ